MCFANSLSARSFRTTMYSPAMMPLSLPLSSTFAGRAWVMDVNWIARRNTSVTTAAENHISGTWCRSSWLAIQPRLISYFLFLGPRRIFIWKSQRRVIDSVDQRRGFTKISLCPTVNMSFLMKQNSGPWSKLEF